MTFQGRKTVPIIGLLMILISIGKVFIYNMHITVFRDIDSAISTVHCSPAGNTTALKTLDSIEDAISRVPLIDLLRGRDGRDGLPGRNREALFTS